MNVPIQRKRIINLAHKVNNEEYQRLKLAELSEGTKKLRFYVLVIRELCNSLKKRC